MYGMNKKSTIYFPDDMKAAIERAARLQGCSEAELIRNAVAQAIERPTPTPGIFSAEPFADQVDELLAGFGER